MKALHMTILLMGTLTGCYRAESVPNAANNTQFAAKLSGYRCPGGTDASIEPQKVGPQRFLGSTHVDSRSVTDATSFRTTCSVTLAEYPSEKDCRWDGEPPPIFKGAIMRIYSDHSGALAMSITEPGGEEYVVDRMRAVERDNYIDYLEGTFDRKKYFVNFVNGLGNAPSSSGPLTKKYNIQVFYQDAASPGGYRCADHMPGSPTKNDAKQGGVGGGTEPGHK